LLRALVVMSRPFAALELTHRVDRNPSFPRRLRQDDRERPQGARDRPPLVRLPSHLGDEERDVLGLNLVEPPAPEVGDQVLVERQL
jgi:hypothetical protein